MITEIRTSPDANAEDHADSRGSRMVTLREDSIASCSIDWSLIRGKVALIIDIIGMGIRSDETINVVMYSAGSLKMIDDLLNDGQLCLNTEFVVYHVGTNIVTDFDRSHIIGKVIKLCKTTRDKYSNIKIYFSTILPRPPDHQLTNRSVIAFNDAIKTGVMVANRRYSPVNHISNHQLFVNPDTSFKAELFHKNDLRLSKKGMRVFKDNILQTLCL